MPAGISGVTSGHSLGGRPNPDGGLNYSAGLQSVVRAAAIALAVDCQNRVESLAYDSVVPAGGPSEEVMQRYRELMTEIEDRTS